MEALTLTSSRRIKGWMPLRVTQVIDETSDTKTFVFVNDSEGVRAFDFEAGQYLSFRFDDLAEKPLVRSYTMSGSPCQREEIFVTVKRVEGGLVSNWMCDHLKTGSVLTARGAMGGFCYYPDKDPENLVMIGAGSGITPFISIGREALYGDNKYSTLKNLRTLAVFRSESDIICRDTLESFEVEGRSSVLYCFTRESNSARRNVCFERPSPEVFAKICEGLDPDKTVLMTCGPTGMMSAVEKFGHTMGFLGVKKESF